MQAVKLSNDQQPAAANEQAPVAHNVTLEEVQALTNELRHLLVHHESTLEQEGIHRQIETMERWMESYRRGISAANKLSEKAPEWLEEVRNKLKLAADELTRLESEGGNPATKEQAKQADDLNEAVRKLDALAPNLEQLLPCKDKEPSSESQS